MAKKPTLTDIQSGYGSHTQINANNTAIETAFENTLSLDGSTPNAMGADLDMNGNDISNAKDISLTGNLVIDGVNFVPTSATTVPDWEGAWATSTAYAVNDLVREDGNVYICLVAHTSGTFSTDLSNSLWELFAQKGSSGAGSGDMLASNNLSDLTNSDTSLANLGGGSKGIAIFKDTTSEAVRTEISAQQQADILDDLSGLTQAAAKIPYFDSATTASTLDFLDEDTMSSNSASGVPSQQSVKAYVDNLYPVVLAKVNTNGSIIKNAGTVGLASVVKVNEGDFTLNFNSALSGSDYVVQVSCENPNNNFISVQEGSPTTTDIKVDIRTRGTTDVDAKFWVTIWDV